MSQCFDLNLSQSEGILASAHFDGTIRMWSIRSGDMINEVKGIHDDVITCVRFTPDEKQFVTTSKYLLLVYVYYY